MKNHLSFLLFFLFLISSVSTANGQTQKPDYSLTQNEYLKRIGEDHKKLETKLKINKAKMNDNRLSEKDREHAAWDYFVANIKLLKSDKEIKSIWKSMIENGKTSLCKSYKKAMKGAENKEVFASEKVLYIYLLSERKFFIEQCK